MNFINKAFIDKNTPVLRRVYCSWHCVFFLRIWKSWLKKNKYKITENFLSSNCYVCIELNAHCLIKIIKQFQKTEGLSKDMFLSFLFNSQPCEQHFRATKSLTATFSTVVNFTIKDILRRTDRIQMIHCITNDLNETFVFPRESKRLRKSKIDSEMDSEDFDVKNISGHEIQATLESALQDVMFKIRELGMSVIGNCWNHIDTPGISDNRENIQNIHDEIHDEKKILIDVGADETNSLSKRFLENLETGKRETSELPDDLLKNLQKIHSINGISSDGLHHKDYSAKKETGRYVAVSVGDKTLIIRKSSLCWLLDQGKERVSSDRLGRFILNNKSKLTNEVNRVNLSPKPKRDRNKKKVLFRKSKRFSTSFSDSSTSENETFHPDDSTDSEVFSSEIEKEIYEMDSKKNSNQK
ncbi:hypothetical protein RN001_004508 [Aquatica leii]|uniref:Uncharacterized protein n=1 Tax=Aquatica leii TaxID=1421715 RepID=A0AAN7SI26_9COLE|nr:hypothetical protein RN001_004508 [Aquatica leii]